MLAQELARVAVPSLAVAQSSEELRAIADDACAGVIWQRQPVPGFQRWIETLDPEQLPSARLILQPKAVRSAAAAACDSAKMPDCAERDHLIGDIASFADSFAALMDAPYLRLRLDRVTTNACRRFHTDAIVARLICTYRGAGTQYGLSTNGAEPTRVFSTPTGSPILLRGTLWPEHPRSGFLHRSPAIEGSGESRFVVVLDPIFDVENET